MEKFIRAHLQEFWSGAFTGGVAGSIFLFPAPLFVNHFFLAYVVKIIGTAVMAGLSGLATAFAVDFYRHKIKQKIFRRNKNG
jgi:hypothetical protein